MDSSFITSLVIFAAAAPVDPGLPAASAPEWISSLATVVSVVGAALVSVFIWLLKLGARLDATQSKKEAEADRKEVNAMIATMSEKLSGHGTEVAVIKERLDSIIESFNRFEMSVQRLEFKIDQVLGTTPVPGPIPRQPTGGGHR